ncbi:MAG: hypothetical protein FJY99_12935 [Candidatus Sericytochromatia bacterium]|nr:hypothetical protein [Candidatus Tanganyikabacteria bacterium]
MSDAHLVVWLEDRAYRFFPGATVRDLVGRLPAVTRRDLEDGKALLTDRDGYEVAEEGALSPGAVYTLVRTASPAT